MPFLWDNGLGDRKKQKKTNKQEREMENRERDKRSVNYGGELAGIESGIQNPIFDLARALNTLFAQMAE